MKNWPGSVVDAASLDAAIGRFLRTHRDGYALLAMFLVQVPADRTELEYQRERDQQFAAPHQAQGQFMQLRADAIARVKREGFED